MGGQFCWYLIACVPVRLQPVPADCRTDGSHCGSCLWSASQSTLSTPECSWWKPHRSVNRHRPDTPLRYGTVGHGTRRLDHDRIDQTDANRPSTSRSSRIDRGDVERLLDLSDRPRLDRINPDRRVDIRVQQRGSTKVVSETLALVWADKLFLRRRSNRDRAVGDFYAMSK
jgi:hypothetical protein